MHPNPLIADALRRIHPQKHTVRPVLAASTRRLIRLGVSAVVADAARRAAEARGASCPDLALSAQAAHARLPAILRDALKRAAAAKAGR